MQTFSLPRGKAATIARLFDYRGKKIRLIAVPKIKFWYIAPGPTHNEYRVVNVFTLDSAGLVGTEGEECMLTPGTAIAVHSLYENVDTGITVYVHPSDQAKLMEAGNGKK